MMAKSMAENTYDLSTFHLKRILSNNTKSKAITVLGTFPSQQSPESNDQAIVVLEKTAFTDDDVNTLMVDHDDENGMQRRYFSVETKLEQEFINDIYGNFLCFPIPAINSNFHHSLYLNFLSHCLDVIFCVPSCETYHFRCLFATSHQNVYFFFFPAN